MILPPEDTGPHLGMSVVLMTGGAPSMEWVGQGCCSAPPGSQHVPWTSAWHSQPPSWCHKPSPWTHKLSSSYLPPCLGLNSFPGGCRLPVLQASGGRGGTSDPGAPAANSPHPWVSAGHIQIPCKAPQPRPRETRDTQQGCRITGHRPVPLNPTSI